MYALGRLCGAGLEGLLLPLQLHVRTVGTSAWISGEGCCDLLGRAYAEGSAVHPCSPGGFLLTV